jgi:hypothetical protein
MEAWCCSDVVHIAQRYHQRAKYRSNENKFSPVASEIDGFSITNNNFVQKANGILNSCL